jgi:uncharacterized protein (TIGR01319 family)
LNRVACVDFGSTYTKALLIDLDEGRLVGSAERRTSIDTDVMDGWEACAVELGAQDVPLIACSSAGGGLRIAVVGNEALVTAEAGRRVALSSGGVVVHVAAGLTSGTAQLHAARPDVVLLVGGTDGGNEQVLLDCAQTLAVDRWPTPVVVAGNADAAEEVLDVLASAGVTATKADNVVPSIGVLEPGSARVAIRTVFLEHVIGGKHLSRGAQFRDAVRGATPDVVLAGVELLAASVGEVVVVDVGGATTDVHSVVEVDPEQTYDAPVVGATPVSRTVEADLGMRWSARSTYDRGVEAGLQADDENLRAAADRRVAEPGWLPSDARGRAQECQLAGLAVGVALRRHAGQATLTFGPDGRQVQRTGTDLREVELLVGSGGVLRHGDPAAASTVLRSATGADVPGGWQLPRAPTVVVDTDYVLVAAGLLAAEHPDVATQLLERHVTRRSG